jgi:hypothetical protein
MNTFTQIKWLYFVFKKNQQSHGRLNFFDNILMINTIKISHETNFTIKQVYSFVVGLLTSTLWVQVTTFEYMGGIQTCLAHVRISVLKKIRVNCKLEFIQIQQMA